MKASIKQISEITGFSQATVSNALNRKKGVNQQTSEKIFKVAEELGYTIGRSYDKIKFVTYRKNGLIIDDSMIFPAMIEGVERQAKSLGYETVFSRLDREDVEFEEKLQEVLNDRESMVILLATEMLEEDYEPFLSYDGYMVLLDGWSDSMRFDAVLINSIDASSMAIEYLIEKGHTKIGYLRGDYRIKAFQCRQYGYEKTLLKHGLEVRPEYSFTVGTQLESAYRDMKNILLKEPEFPTAIFADDDLIAVSAMRAMTEAGIRIPEDVSVVGFDDERFGMLFCPALTTIRVYKQEMGEIAVRRLLDYIRYPGGESHTKIEVSADFIERESVRDIR